MLGERERLGGYCRDLDRDRPTDRINLHHLEYDRERRKKRTTGRGG